MWSGPVIGVARVSTSRHESTAPIASADSDDSVGRTTQSPAAGSANGVPSRK